MKSLVIRIFTHTAVRTDKQRGSSTTKHWRSDSLVWHDRLDPHSRVVIKPYAAIGRNTRGLQRHPAAMLKLYRVARTKAQPGTRGYTAPTRAPISCHSCHGHYLHIVIAGSVKDYYYYYYYYYYDYDNTITNTGYNLLHLYSYNVSMIRSQPAYMCQMLPHKCHYQYMT